MPNDTYNRGDEMCSARLVTPVLVCRFSRTCCHLLASHTRLQPVRMYTRADTYFMEFTVTADRLSNALSAADGVVKGGSVLGPLPAAEIVVQDGHATVVASDGVVSLRTTFAVTNSHNGSVTIAPHAIGAFLSNLAGTTAVTCRRDGQLLVVSAGATAYRFATIDSVYPAIEEAGGEVQTCTTAGLPAMLHAVRHAVDARTGMVKLTAADNKLRMYATDSYRLCVASSDHDDSQWSVLIPISWLQFALRYSPDRVDIDQRGRLASFHGADVSITIRLGAAAFPAVASALVTRPAHHARVHARTLLAAAGRLASVADNEPFRVHITPTALTLSAMSSVGDGHEHVEATSDSEGTFGVAVRNLIDAATACGETIDLYYSDPKQPVWMLGSRDGIDVHCVVMPAFWQDA